MLRQQVSPEEEIRVQLRVQLRVQIRVQLRVQLRVLLSDSTHRCIRASLNLWANGGLRTFLFRWTSDWKSRSLLTARSFALDVEPHTPVWPKPVDFWVIFHWPVVV